MLDVLDVSDQHHRGGDSSGSAALHVQAGVDRRRGESGETLEVLWV